MTGAAASTLRKRRAAAAGRAVVVGGALNARELAALSLPGMPKTERGVQMLADRHKWRGQQRLHRGGGVEYPMIELLRVLPRPAAADLRRRAERPKPPARAGRVAVEGGQAADTSSLTDRQRECGSARLAVVEAVVGIARDGDSSYAAAIERVRRGEVSPELREQVRIAKFRNRLTSLGANTIREWLREVWPIPPEGASPDWRLRAIAALAPGDRRRSEPPPWSAALLDLWQTPQKRALRRVLKDLPERLPEGVPAPSYDQACRFLQSQPAPERERGRRGPRKMKEILPFTRRDPRKLGPGGCYCGDGHQFDAEVRHPITGQPFRPEVTLVIDVYSRLIVGWSVDLVENTRAVADALRHACETHGRPLVYYADRGPGQDNRALEQILQDLGIERARSIPYNSQARGVIENWNKRLVAAAQRLPTYIGKPMDAEAKSRIHKRTRRECKDIGTSRLLLTWAQFTALIEQTIAEENATAHGPNSWIAGRRPIDVWREGLETIRRPRPVSAELSGCLFRPHEIRQVRRGEVSLFGVKYFSRELAWHHDQEVRAHYDVQDGSRIWVRDLDGRLIAVAERDGNVTDYFAQERLTQADERQAVAYDREQELARPAVTELEPEVAAAAAASKPEGEIIELFGDDADRWLARALRLEAIEAEGGELSDGDRRWLGGARTEKWYSIEGRQAAS